MQWEAQKATLTRRQSVAPSQILGLPRKFTFGEDRAAASHDSDLGGAVGNLIDRAWLGQVIDFIQLYYDRWYWPAFNIADSAITIGATLLVLESLWSRNANDLKNPAA